MIALGKILIVAQNEEFENVILHFKEYKLNKDTFIDNKREIIYRSHKFAFTLNIFINKIEKIPDYSEPYILQLKSDSIQLISSYAFDNIRFSKLLLRSIIENIFKFIYYTHHPIEHLLLQTDECNYENTKTLYEYAKNHPFFNNKEIVISIEKLYMKYKEVSKYIHATKIKHMDIINDLKSIQKITNISKKDVDELNLILQNSIYVISYFFKHTYTNLNMDEKTIINSFLKDLQIKEISGLK